MMRIFNDVCQKSTVVHAHLWRFGVTILMLTPMMSQAVPANFHGTLREDTPCIVNDDNPIRVQFGDVQVKNVVGQEGLQYKQTVPYTLTCNDAADTQMMTVSVSGTVASWGQGYFLQTNIPNLGLKFFVDGNAKAIGEAVDFPYKTQPPIEVIPEGNAALTDNDSGYFSAVANLTVEYQ